MEGMGVAREGRKGRWKGLKGIEEMGGEASEDRKGRVKDAKKERKRETKRRKE